QERIAQAVGHVSADARDERDLGVSEVGLALVADERDTSPTSVTGPKHRAQLRAEAKRAMDLAITRAPLWLAVRFAREGGHGLAAAQQVVELGVVRLE